MARLFLFILLFSSFLFSSELKVDLAQAKKTQNVEYNIALSHFKNKNYEKAYEMFSNLFVNDMGNILINFYLGRSAYELGKYDFAISAYDRILIQQPNNTRVKLELAQTYLKMNLYVHALREFEAILKHKMPLLVRKRVETNIALIKSKKQKHFFNITALLGLIYDSNINASPKAGAYDIYSPTLDSVLTLENDGEKEGTTIYQLLAIASYKYKVNDNFILDNTITPFVLKYNNHNEKDIHAVSLNIAPTYFQKDYKISLAFMYDRINLAHESYQSNFYLSPKYSRALSKRLLYELSAKLGRINYFEDKDKDAKMLEFKNSFKYLTNKLGVFSLGLELGREYEINDSRTDVSKKYYTFSLSNSYDFLDSYLLQTSLAYEKNNYTDTDVNFLNKREDKKYDASIGIQKIISNSLVLSAGVTYTKNESNHEPFEYDKYTLKTNLIYSF